MVDLAGQFGVALTAQVGVDRASLRKAEKDVGDAIGKPLPGVKLSPDLRTWQKSVAALDKAIPKGAIGDVSKKLWGNASGQIKSLDEIKKASIPAAKETGFVARHLTQIKTRLKESWHLDGFGRAVEQFREGRKELGEFRDKAEGIGKLFGPAEGLLAIGGAAGIGGLVESFGSRSGGLLRASGRIGVSADMLQRWGGAAELAGLSSDQATGSIDALQKTLRFARLGVPQGAQALGTAKFLGLDVREDPAEFLKHLADRMRGQAPKIQEAMAEAFGVGDLLPLLQKGRQAIDAYTKAARDNRFLSPEQIEAGRQLEYSYTGAIQATLGLKDAIGAQLAPTFTPLLTGYTNWINRLKETPGELQAVTHGVELLAAATGVLAVGALGKLIAATNAWWMLPATKALWWLGTRGLTWGVGAGFATFFGGKATGGGEIGAEGNQPGFQRSLDQGTDVNNLTPEQAAQALAQGYDFPADLKQRLEQRAAGQNVPAGVQSPAGVTPPAGVSTGPVANQIVGTARGAGANDGAIQAMIAGALGEGNVNQPWKPGDNNSSFGPWQLHQDGELDRYLREGNRTGDVAAQTRYVLTRLNEIMPGFSQSKDLSAQIDAVRRFENSVYGNRPGSTYYSQNLPGAGDVLHRVDAGASSGGILTSPASAAELPGAMQAPGVRRIDRAIGDSIAEGLAQAGKLREPTSWAGYQGHGAIRDRDDPGLDAVWGRSPSQVLAAIHGMDPASLKGRHIVLSSGASNDPTQIMLARDQIATLKAAGADVTLVGVGQGVANYKSVNERLSEIAAEQSVPFSGTLATTEGGLVHPRDYGAVLRQALDAGAPVGAEGAAPSVKPSSDAGSDYEPADSDTMHHLVVEFVNAPPGMRSGLRAGHGPTDVTVRTQTAFEAP